MTAKAQLLPSHSCHFSTPLNLPEYNLINWVPTNSLSHGCGESEPRPSRCRPRNLSKVGSCEAIRKPISPQKDEWSCYARRRVAERSQVCQGRERCEFRTQRYADPPPDEVLFASQIHADHPPSAVQALVCIKAPYFLTGNLLL